jgi:hypothetical protein
VDGAVKVDEAVEERFGSFEWLNYDIQKESEISEDTDDE